MSFKFRCTNDVRERPDIRIDDATGLIYCDGEIVATLETNVYLDDGPGTLAYDMKQKFKRFLAHNSAAGPMIGLTPE